MAATIFLTALAASIPFATAQTTCSAAPAPAFPTTPTKPANDPFWKPPGNLNSLAQGAVFNCRGVNWNKVDGAQAYYQYAYKTVLSNGTSVVSVATLLIPDHTSTTPQKQFKQLLSYQVPYDSPTSFCGPSFVNQPLSGNNTSNTYFLTQPGGDQAPSQALKQGIPVVISDYETALAAFTVGVTEGYGTLNGIRAVVQSSGYFATNPQVALWGYSGGALATEFALELYAGTNAKDLNIIGAAIGGLTPITRNVAIMVNGRHNNASDPAQTVYNALIPYAALGIANENSTVSAWIQSNLNNAATEPGAPNQHTYAYRFDYAQSDNCNIETAPDFINSNFTVDWFKGYPSTKGSIFDNPTISDALNLYGIMGQTVSGSRATPNVPLYVYKGTADEVSNVTDTTNLVNKYCKAGARIQYVQLQGDTHQQAQSDGFNGAWQYLANRFAGQTAPSTC